MPKITTEQVKNALIECHGLAYAAARQLKVAPSTIFRRVQKSPELGEFIRECHETRLDEAEGQLMAAVRRGEAWAVCFFLKTQGRHRGYSERLEVAPTIVRREIVEEVVTATYQPPALPGTGLAG